MSGLDRGQSNRESRVARIDAIKIDQRRQRFLQRIDEVHGRPFDADAGVDAPCESRIEEVKTGHAGQKRRQLAQWLRQPRIELIPKRP
jgi:hypothetical protein